MSDTPEEPTSEERLEQFRSSMASGNDTLSLIADLNEGILEKSGLDLRTFYLVRAAAMAACGAPAFSWQVMLEVFGDDVTGADLMGTLTAIAPIIGTAAYAAAAENILAD